MKIYSFSSSSNIHKGPLGYIVNEIGESGNIDVETEVILKHYNVAYDDNFSNDIMNEVTKKYNPIVCTEVGQHQMWVAQLFEFNEPRKLITSGGLGTMGFGFPAAIGAQVGEKDNLVLNIAGDGSIQMNIQEIATCVDIIILCFSIPLKKLMI